MRNPATRASGSLDEDLHRLEIGIRQLKIQYDMFFGGGLKTEPRELRRSLEKIIKRYSNASITRYADRFRLNALISRFNSFAELWGKTVRSREEGDRRPAATADPQGLREQLITRGVLGDPDGEQQELRRLHRRFVEASRRHDPRRKAVPFERFAQGVTAQSRNLRQKSGCDQIELRIVVRDDQVQLKARPGK